MGSIRRRPERLPEKLLYSRLALGLSQTEMWRRLEMEDLTTYHAISKYERGVSEPPLDILMRYARLVGVSMDVFADDEVDLPKKLPVKGTNRR